MKLVAIKKITGTIKLKSGLHIGAGNMEMHIGGTDSNVIKHPHTLQPYIPGSSVKGKTRSLLELSLGLINYTDGAVVKAETLSRITREDDKKNAETILKLFGCGAGNDNEEILAQIGPSRASFLICLLAKNGLKNIITMF
jgi:CRISPR-associated protein Csm3